MYNGKHITAPHSSCNNATNFQLINVYAVKMNVYIYINVTNYLFSTEITEMYKEVNLTNKISFVKNLPQM